MNYTNLAFATVAGASALQFVKDYYYQATTSTTRHVYDCDGLYAGKETIPGSFNPFSEEGRKNLSRNLNSSFYSLINSAGSMVAFNFLTQPGASNEFKFAAAGACLAYTCLTAKDNLEVAKRDMNIGLGKGRNGHNPCNIKDANFNYIIIGIRNAVITAMPILAAGTIAYAELTR